MEIQVLPSNVIDQIAAGEVVDRPAHLVKELLENALDAGATKLEIDFAQGGQRVTVTDNGHGMNAENLLRAFERHATSKITEAHDLWKLKTFGFRGEALASVASVSRVTAISKPVNSETGFRLRLAFGCAEEIEKVSAESGTQIQISDLFENVPARKKFLKTDGAEAQQVRQVIKALALANPLVEFRWLENRELMGYWPRVENYVQRAEQVFELSPLFIGTYQKGAYKATAVMASPEIVAKTARNIWIFAQNRWIQDRALQTACIEAYRNLLMHGEYPTCCVWIESDPAEVDVNVHPTKSQVKFSSPGDVFRAVYHSLRDELEKGPWLKKTPYQPTPIFAQESILTQQQTWSAPEFQKIQYQVKSSGFSHRVEDNRSVPSSSLPTMDQYVAAAESRKSTLEDSAVLNSISNPFSVSKTASNSNLGTANGPWSSLQVLGQATKTYLICQSHESLVLIDQHAAHERVAFERLMLAWKSGQALDVQNYLFPLSIDLSEAQTEGIETQFDELMKIGIRIEVLGPRTVGVLSAPSFLKEKALAKAIDELSQEIVDLGPSFVFEKKIADLFASMACHSVVRAGQSLAIEQMQELLQQMDEFPLSSFCPHGRPVSVEMSFAKLEKDFGRKI